MLACAACSSASGPEGEARLFVHQHGREASRTAAAVRAVERDISALPVSAVSTQLRRLIPVAVRARRAAVLASEWSPVSSSEAGSEEENVPRAEAQVSEAADELLSALKALESYARTRRPAARSRYESAIAHTRVLWNEGISQLWFIARRHDPPTL